MRSGLSPDWLGTITPPELASVPPTPARGTSHGVKEPIKSSWVQPQVLLLATASVLLLRHAAHLGTTSGALNPKLFSSQKGRALHIEGFPCTTRLLCSSSFCLQYANLSKQNRARIYFPTAFPVVCLFFRDGCLFQGNTLLEPHKTTPSCRQSMQQARLIHSSPVTAAAKPPALSSPRTQSRSGISNLLVMSNRLQVKYSSHQATLCIQSTPCKSELGCGEGN